MQMASLHRWSTKHDAPTLRRAGVSILVTALHLILLVMLLRLAPPPPLPRPKPSGLTTIQLMPEAEIAPEPAKAARKQKEEGGAARRVVAPAPPTAPPESTSSAIWSQVIPMTRQQLAAADIANIPSRPAMEDGRGTGQSGNDAGENDSASAGRGPNGQPLYNAEWYRRPTDAELSYYLPPGTRQPGWGMIACQTVSDYRVENCQEIGQSPAGSGLARAVRQAAWQFRVLPPRIGGRPMVGAWVSIRIDYSVSGPG